MRPEWLDEALAGQPVVLRNGGVAYVRHYEEELEATHPLWGYSIINGAAHNSVWLPNGRKFKDNESPDDIVGLAPLVFEHWHLLHKDIKRIAKDEDGAWCGYSSKPERGISSWDISDYDMGEVYFELNGLAADAFPKCDWKNSLIQRPED